VDRSSFDEHPDPNIVLRGGPLHGHRMRVSAWVPIDLPAGGERCFYGPTSERDAEYPELIVYAFHHAEPA
jgi:hypothetical protein